MAKNIEDLYRDHMQANSPDMDKLWKRIEQRIDDSQKPAPKAQTEEQAEEKQKITVSSTSWKKYAGVAACLIVVVIAAVVFTKGSDSDYMKYDESGSYAEARNDAANSDQDKAVISKGEEEDAAQQGYNFKRDQNAKTNDVASGAENEKVAENDGRNISAADPALPKNRIKALMKEDSYRNETLDGKLKLIEKLADEMKSGGEIKSFEIKKRDTNCRVEITMPDDSIVGLIIK